MIRNEDGEKCSAKELAQQILLRCLERAEFWQEANKETMDAMTDREMEMLNNQLSKLFVRAVKVMGVSLDEIQERSNDPLVDDRPTPYYVF